MHHVKGNRPPFRARCQGRHYPSGNAEWRDVVGGKTAWRPTWCGATSGIELPGGGWRGPGQAGLVPLVGPALSAQTRARRLQPDRDHLPAGQFSLPFPTWRPSLSLSFADKLVPDAHAPLPPGLTRGAAAKPPRPLPLLLRPRSQRMPLDGVLDTAHADRAARRRLGRVAFVRQPFG